MFIKMIRWKLRELMARKRITNRDLALLIGKSEVSISRLKNQDEMPRLDGEALEELCKALGCTPADLLEYSPEVVVTECGFPLIN